ncbi:hypothetical protein [Streptomyces sp. NPDC056549]|uniref:hypothetical protein n=1 Tax=Streptomyces sp. NPDC056549 TaxID=3345864 RepID=UPI00368FCC6B
MPGKAYVRLAYTQASPLSSQQPASTFSYPRGGVAFSGGASRIASAPSDRTRSSLPPQSL